MAETNIPTIEVPQAEVASTTPKTNDRYVAITLTPELAAALDKARGDQSRGLYARELVAKALKVEVNVDRHAPKKYATPEEKVAAQLKARTNRAELVKLLKQAHKLRIAGQVEEAAKLDEEARKYY